MPALFDESFAVQMEGHGSWEKHKCSTVTAIAMTVDLSTEVARMMKVCRVALIALYIGYCNIEPKRCTIMTWVRYASHPVVSVGRSLKSSDS